MKVQICYILFVEFIITLFDDVTNGKAANSLPNWIVKAGQEQG